MLALAIDVSVIIASNETRTAPASTIASRREAEFLVVAEVG
jgi:hypothetical protein